MTRDQAMREAKKRWGKNALIRVSALGVSSPEARAAGTAAHLERKQRYEELKAEKEARLAALDWLRELNDKIAEAGKEMRNNQWKQSYYRFSVGTNILGFAFGVEGEGDTWEEAFEKASRKK